MAKIRNRSRPFYIPIFSWILLGASLICILYLWTTSKHQENLVVMHPPPDQDVPRKTLDLDAAQRIMKDKNVIFVGTVRDVEKYIETSLQHIEECAKKFNDYCVVIYENDSKDRTRQLLQELKHHNYHYIFEDGVQEPRRTVRIAHGRNRILDTIRALNARSYYDYMIAVDMDDRNQTGSYVKTMDTCFQYDTGSWDVMTANQRGKYYDIWALRKKHDMDGDYIYRPDLERNRNYPVGGLLAVDSAFGGVGIYKLSAIRSGATCRYIGVYEANNPDGIPPDTEKCEHVDFNQCLRRQGGTIFINTEWLTDL